MLISSSSIFQSVVCVIHVREDKTPGEQRLRVHLWNVECHVLIARVLCH